MATVALTAFLPEVLPSAPSCPNVKAVNALRNAAIEFCTKTQIVQEFQELGDVSSGGFPFILEAPAGSRVCGILMARYDGATLSPTTRDVLDATGREWETEAGAPQRYFSEAPDTVSVYPLPEVTGEFSLRVAFCPKRDASYVEEILFQEYLEAIASGALYRLLAEPGQAYTNPDTATFHGRKFHQEIANARHRVLRAFTREAGATRIRSLA